MAGALKDMVDRGVVEEIAARFAAADPSFAPRPFVTAVMEVLPRLELKARFEAIARRLRSALDDDYRTALETVVAVARAEPPIGGFAAWPLCTFVELFGVDDPDASLPAMEHLTKRASCEFAIRPFLVAHWDAAYTRLVASAGHPDAAVRRLASEGTRPRLPWGMRVPRLIEEPAPGLAIIERLRDDPSEVVRRSVANHLNDVAKDHPDLVVETAARWLEDGTVDRKMIAHALRTLVKRGDAGALEVLGYTTQAAVEVVDFVVAPAAIEIGERIELGVTLRSTDSAPQHLVVDFIVHHVNASGATSPKVFKWATIDLEPGATLALRKRRMIQHASTRTYYPGIHRVELQVAGAVVAEAAFDIVV